jgi:hypothetical protein
MSKRENRYRLNNYLAKQLGIEQNKCGRYTLTPEQEKDYEAIKELNRGSVVDEAVQQGGLKDNTWKTAWLKTDDVSVYVRNPDYKEETIDYDTLRLDMIEEMKQLSPVVKQYKRKPITDPHCLVLDIADPHFGKLATVGGTGSFYNVDLAIERAIEASEDLINASKPYNIDKVFFIIGNDVLHTDNTTGSTTKGTSQNIDGMWYDNFKIARMVYAQIIQRLTSIAPVHVIHCPSNHDYMTGFMLADSISCFFHANKNVTFDASNRHRKYTTYGKNLLAFSHGDGAKVDQVPYLAAHEEPQMWADTIYRYCFLHHIHHKEVFKFRSGKDFIGMTIEYLRSPSEADQWHADKGFVGAKIAIESFIHHPTKGQVARHTHNF